MKYVPPLGATDSNASYQDGNPEAGILGSIVPAAAIETPQREIMNAIIQAGLSPDTDDLNQLARAIVQLSGCAVWNSTQDYAPPTLRFGSDGKLYVALAPSGPGVMGVGAKTPGAAGSEGFWRQALDEEIVATGSTAARTLSDRFADTLDVRDFGAKPDFNPSTKTGTDNLQYIQDAIYHCVAHHCRLRIAGGMYGCWTSGSTRTLTNAASAFNGQQLGGLDIPSGTVIEWADDSWLIQMAPSYSGAFMSNINRPVRLSSLHDVEWSTDGVLLINPRIDGSYSPLYTDLTLSQEMAEPLNDNAIGFGGHFRNVNGTLSPTIYDTAQNIVILGGVLRGYRDTNGNGGKGIGVERGVHHLTVIGTRVEDCCYATSVIFETTGAKAARAIAFRDMDVRRCGVALIASGQDDSDGGASSDPAQCSVDWQGTAWCCGHHPDFSTLKTEHYRRHYKHGVVVLYAATAVHVDIAATNPAGFPSAAFPCGGTLYPSAYPVFTPGATPGTDTYYTSMMRGAGLSGSIGSLVSGWGYGCVVRGDLDGDCDDLWTCNSGTNYGNSRQAIDAKNMRLDLTCSGSVKTIYRNDIAAPSLAIATISGDRETITLGATQNLADRDNDLLGEHLLIGSAYYPVTSYVASTRTIALETALDASVVVGDAVYITSSHAASGTNLTGSLKAVCRDVTQYITPYWSLALSQLLLDVDVLSGANACRVLSPIAVCANGRYSGVAYAVANGGVALGNPCAMTLGVDTLTPGISGVLVISAPAKIGGNLIPATDNTAALGISTNRWTQVFAASGTINTSDAREKEQIQPYPDAVLDAWGDVELRQYIFSAAYESKGDAARIHAGVIAQQIMAAFAAHGLDATRYGLLCHDAWPAQEEVSHVEMVTVSEGEQDADGAYVTLPVYEERTVVDIPFSPAGDRWGVRYEEALCLEAAYQRRRADRIEARVAALEARI